MNILYFMEVDRGRIGVEFDAVDRDSNSREDIIKKIRGGDHPRKILAVCEDEGWVRDVTDEIVTEAEQPKEPASWEEIGNRIAALWDHAFDHRKNWEAAE